MTGRRIADGSNVFEPGDYSKGFDGHWYARTPNGLLAGLRNHSVREHEDGTISVEPSILVHQPNVGQWHGYLQRGIWKECA